MKYKLIAITLCLSLFTGCGLKKTVQKGLSQDAYYQVTQAQTNTSIESDYLIFYEINNNRLTDAGGLILGIGPRKLFLKEGTHSFKVHNGKTAFTFKNIKIENNHKYFFGYIEEETFWLKDLTTNKVLYGFEPKS